MDVFKKFALELLEQWKVWLLSSLPMAVIAVALLLRPDIAPLPLPAWFGLIFGVALLVAVFRVYRENHFKLLAAEEKMRPKIICTFGEQVPGCIVPTLAGSNRAKWIKLKIEADSIGIVRECCATLIALNYNNETIFDNESLYLSIAPSERVNPEFKDIRDRVPEYADLLGVIDTNDVFITTPGFVMPRSIRNPEALFRLHGHYTLKVVVSSPDTKSVVCYPRMTWRGDWKTVRFEMA